ncbi:MAG: hypothetical protein DHS20C01_29140 [marine bacterium B5-7]|nr:MAG: hypothetical protein DHS20C01_29140 [marine bacterium B5-7]
MPTATFPINALEVARMANDAGLPCTPYSTNLSMVTLFTKYYLKALPDEGNNLEFSIVAASPYPWQEELFNENTHKTDAGHVAIGDLPGWGATINPRWLDGATCLVTTVCQR